MVNGGGEFGLKKTFLVVLTREYLFKTERHE